MLLAIVHANGAYYPKQTMNELPFEMQDGYHERLASLVEKHVGDVQPVAYLPYWIDPYGTNIHHEPGLQAAALLADPFYRLLSTATKEQVNVIPDGTDPGLDGITKINRDKQLDRLALNQDKVCFVGAYAGACVLARATQMQVRMSPAERPFVFIDPGYSVDIISRPVRSYAAGKVELAAYESMVEIIKL